MSNGIGKNPLIDISKVYLQQVANEGTMDIKGFAIPKSEQDAAKKRVQDKTKKKQMEKGISSAGYTKEGLDPVNPVAVKKKFANRKDTDLNNDGDTDSSDKYLHKRRKAIAGAMKKRMSEGIRDMDPEKGTAERKARLEKKRGMKMDDHPQYKKEEVEQIDEISQKTATKAFAKRATDEYETDSDSKKSDAAKSRIVKKFGKKAGDHAERAAHRNTFGRSNMPSMSKEELELDENRRASRAAGGYKDDSKKQTDPSKEGFTGISGSIKDIMRQNKEIEAKNKKMKESFSSWRTDLSEIMTDDIDSKPVKEKKINNKIKINPKLGEAVEALGGEILEMIEVDEELTGERKKAAAKKINTAKSGSDRAVAFNLATRNDMGSSYQKKSTGGKGSRFPGYGDRGAGNKAERRMGKAPMRQGPEKRVTEAVYGGTPAKKEAPKDNRMVVTAADKKGNTPAYQRMKSGDKRYKAADHMKESSFKKIQEKLNLKKTQWGV